MSEQRPQRPQRLTPARLTALEALIGVALIVAGAAMVSIPAALIVAGVALFLPAVWPSRRS